MSPRGRFRVSHASACPPETTRLHNASETLRSGIALCQKKYLIKTTPEKEKKACVHIYKQKHFQAGAVPAPLAPGTLLVSYCMLVVEGDTLPPGVPVASSCRQRVWFTSRLGASLACECATREQSAASGRVVARLGSGSGLLALPSPRPPSCQTKSRTSRLARRRT